MKAKNSKNNGEAIILKWIFPEYFLTFGVDTIKTFSRISSNGNSRIVIKFFGYKLVILDAFGSLIDIKEDLNWNTSTIIVAIANNKCTKSLYLKSNNCRMLLHAAIANNPIMLFKTDVSIESLLFKYRAKAETEKPDAIRTKNPLSLGIYWTYGVDKNGNKMKEGVEMKKLWKMAETNKLKRSDFIGTFFTDSRKYELDIWIVKRERRMYKNIFNSKLELKGLNSSKSLFMGKLKDQNKIQNFIE